jgi:hypothetical protein
MPMLRHMRAWPFSRRALALGATVCLLVVGAATLPTALAAPRPGKEDVVLNQGRILMTVHPFEWVGFGGDTTLLKGLDVSLLSVGTPPGEGSAGVSPDLVTSLYGKRLRLVEVQFCYDATDTDVTLTQFLMRVDRNTTGTTETNPVAGAVDTTHRTDESCRSHAVDWVLDPGDMAAAAVTVDFGDDAGRFEVGRLTFVLEPTDQPTS